MFNLSVSLKSCDLLHLQNYLLAVSFLWSCQCNRAAYHHIFRYAYPLSNLQMLIEMESLMYGEGLQAGGHEKNFVQKNFNWIIGTSTGAVRAKLKLSVLTC